MAIKQSLLINFILILNLDTAGYKIYTRVFTGPLHPMQTCTMLEKYHITGLGCKKMN